MCYLTEKLYINLLQILIMLKNQRNCILHLFPGRVLECFRFSFHLLQSISYKMLLSETITQFSTIKKKQQGRVI